MMNMPAAADKDCSTIKTRDDFRTTREFTADVGRAIKEEWANEMPGLVYAGLLHIEATDRDSYCLTIGNASRVSTDLAELEAELFEFGVREEYFPSAKPSAD